MALSSLSGFGFGGAVLPIVNPSALVKVSAPVKK